MATYNRATVLGYLGRDPEIRYMPNGEAVATLSVATTESWKDKESGERQEATEWHRCVLFGKRAEVAGEYLKKGSLVLVEGSLKTRKWADKDGVERYTTEIRGNNMVMVGPRTNGTAHAAEGSSPAPNQSKPAQGEKPKGGGAGKGAHARAQQEDALDIPFASFGFEHDPLFGRVNRLKRIRA